MPHFFINSTSVHENKIIISDKENFTHIAKSLRARANEKLLLIDENQIQYETIIENISSKEILCKVKKSYKSNCDLNFNLYLAQSPLRSDAQSFVVEKATELGVRALIPILTDNCALNKQVIDKKIERWNRIMYEASKQCERAIVPKCEPSASFEKLVNSGRFDKIIAFCERCAKKTLRDFFVDTPIKEDENVLVIIGPEGGFSEREFCFFKDSKIPMLTLGDLILKAETAVTVALGNIIYEFENYRKN
ncbi:hypothetical protein DBY21_06760 [Candidatus Gastranaerophilales bacterium]|nr:MAG: hypothetical protein DBY21_06760 [Candidatus Gastranaerophilales bacterium]